MYSNRVKSALALCGIVMVVGTLFLLSTLEPPIDRPKDPTHQLNFNIKGELSGLNDKKPAKPLLKKEMAQWVNIECMKCHGAAPATEMPSKDVHIGLSKLHPPKNTCIKCHRSSSH